jgi:predicted amidophosphoribosyltransferase
MNDAAREARQEFWRPPLSQPNPVTNLAEACRRCGTEFMVGAAFCHICGASRHRADLVPARSWIRYLSFLRVLEFSRVKSWVGLPLPSLFAFLLGVAFLIAGLSMIFVPVNTPEDIAVVQLWRIQWLIAGCAAFLAGILLKGAKSER